MLLFLSQAWEDWGSFLQDWCLSAPWSGCWFPGGQSWSRTTPGTHKELGHSSKARKHFKLFLEILLCNSFLSCGFSFPSPTLSIWDHGANGQTLNQHHRPGLCSLTLLGTYSNEPCAFCSVLFSCAACWTLPRAWFTFLLYEYQAKVSLSSASCALHFLKHIHQLGILLLPKSHKLRFPYHVAQCDQTEN